jgi:hypothetical protein
MRAQKTLIFGALFVFALSVQIVEGDIWQVWGDKANQICLGMVKKLETQQKKISTAVCENIQEVVESALYSLVIDAADGMKKDSAEVKGEALYNSLSRPYRSEGEFPP